MGGICFVVASLAYRKFYASTSKQYHPRATTEHAKRLERLTSNAQAFLRILFTAKPLAHVCWRGRKHMLPTHLRWEQNPFDLLAKRLSSSLTDCVDGPSVFQLGPSTNHRQLRELLVTCVPHFSSPSGYPKNCDFSARCPRTVSQSRLNIERGRQEDENAVHMQRDQRKHVRAVPRKVACLICFGALNQLYPLNCVDGPSVCQ